MHLASELPLITGDLAGIGGELRDQPEDFVVDEIPAYTPAKAGEHILATIEKRDLTTADATRSLARALGVSPRDIGTAGLKDRRAVTRQQISLPPPCTPDQVLALDLPGLRVIAADRHPNKLKTGHLRGNQFEITIRRTSAPPDEATERARALLAILAEAPGCPNWYGEQRFGATGDNAARGRALVLGERPLSSEPPKTRRLLISAYQSALFNDWLRRRIHDGFYRRVLGGDLLSPVGSRGVFDCVDIERDQARLAAGEIMQTGPMFGHRMRQAPADTPAGDRERAVLADQALELDAFKRVGKLALGTRRPIAVPIQEWSVAPTIDGVTLRFALPPGAYATAVLREIMK